MVLMITSNPFDHRNSLHELGASRRSHDYNRPPRVLKFADSALILVDIPLDCKEGK